MRWVNTVRRPILANEFLDLLVSELLLARAGQPGTLYLISPWMGWIDLPLANSGYFADLFPGQVSLSLFELLQQLARSGTLLRLIARTPNRWQKESPQESETQELLTRLRQAGGNHVAIGFLPDLHAKLYVGQTAAMAGSANLTRYGLGRNNELVCFTANPTEVGALRVEAEALWQQLFTTPCGRR